MKGGLTHLHKCVLTLNMGAGVKRGVLLDRFLCFSGESGKRGWKRLLVGLHNYFPQHLDLPFTYLMQWSQDQDCNCGDRSRDDP